MAEPVLDDLALPVASEPPTRLAERLFAVYRQLAREREATARLEQTARTQGLEEAARFRLRLAGLAAETFHLRRAISSVRVRMEEAGLHRELQRMELMMKRFEQALDRHRIQVETLDGREVDAALADLADVESFVTGPVGTTRVRETIEPLVKVDGEIVMRPRIITEVPE